MTSWPRLGDEVNADAIGNLISRGALGRSVAAGLTHVCPEASCRRLLGPADRVVVRYRDGEDPFDPVVTGNRALRYTAMVLIQPKLSSMHLRIAWLMA